MAGIDGGMDISTYYKDYVKDSRRNRIRERNEQIRNNSCLTIHVLHPQKAKKAQPAPTDYLDYIKDSSSLPKADPNNSSTVVESNFVISEQFQKKLDEFRECTKSALKNGGSFVPESHFKCIENLPKIKEFPEGIFSLEGK